MKRKQPKRVRCWLRSDKAVVLQVYLDKVLAKLHAEFRGGTITPGYFVADAPKPNPKAKGKKK